MRLRRWGLSDCSRASSSQHSGTLDDCIAAARSNGLFDNTEELARRVDLEHLDMRQLAAADALLGLSSHRRNQVWDAVALCKPPELLKRAAIDEVEMDLPEAAEDEAVRWDFRATRLTLRSHPLTLQCARLRRYATATKLAKVPNSVPIRCCGTVALRQSPPTAMGVLFISLEDETGAEQVIVWAIVRDEYRDVFGRSSCLFVMSAGSAEATRAISQRAAILAI